jgi:uncharacterized protein
MEIKFRRKLRMDASVMIAGWPGMGNVATDTVDYLRRKLSARIFAEINAKSLYVPEGVLVEKGQVAFPRPPSTAFYYRKNPPVTLLKGSSQFHGREGELLMRKVLDVAKQVNTEAVFTSAAFPVPMNHQDAAEIYFAANSRALSRDFRKIGLKPLKSGQISGLNGMLLGYAKERGIDAACLLSTIPQYSIGIPNPRAVIEIIDVFAQLLDEEIDLTELEDSAEEIDKKLDAIEANVKEFMSYPVENRGAAEPAGKEKIPGRIIDKIEKLFEEAKSSRQKAVQLKEELDRWDLYPLYEDRFLDLFRKNH